MKVSLTCYVLLGALPLLVRAETRTLDAYLIDQKCLSYYRETQPEKFRDHSRACVLACGRESGYGIITIDMDEYFRLDVAGNRLAEAWLEASGKEKDLRVKVTIAYEDGKSKVLRIE